MNPQPQHRWHFFRAGGFDQVRIESGQDILHLDQLDRKLWVALACPTQGLEFDPKTLALLDTDHDGRIRSPEIIAAAKWTASLLKNPDDLVHSKPALPLAAINDATPEGRTLFSSARQILINLGKDADAAGAEITPEDTADTARIFANTSFNGDGVLPADGARDAGGALEAIINDIIACFGSQADRSGKPGITQDRADQFFDEAQRVEDSCTHNAERLMPLGEATPAAFELVGLAPRINHYFTLVGLAAYAPAAAEAIHRAQEDYPTIASTPEALAAKLNELPLARIEPGRALPLKEGINPAYQAAMGRLRDEVVTPLLGEQSVLSEEQWRAIEEKFSVFAAVRHMAVTKLGFKRVREILAHRTAEGADAKTAIAALIAKDKALEPEATSIAEVDKLVRYHRDLFHLLNNFVGFRDFYARRGKAVFQAGTLYLDQRACDLCVRVDDPAKHALMAHLARTYLAYCDITRKGADGAMEKMSVAAAYTAGDSDNLMVGRNGIFFDRLGRDWDATITKIIENPISIRQAFFSPYKRALRMIGDQVAKRAAAADAQATERIQAAAANAAVAATTGVAPPPPPPPPKAKIDVGVVAALGAALGALSTAFGYFLGWLGSVHLYLLPVYVLAIILLISLPSMLIAWFKLRQRNLGPILDANGWAVNAKAKINLPFGRSLTHTPKLPPGSRHNLVDPFAEKHTVRNCVIAVLIIAAILLGCWYFGLVERMVPQVFPESPFMLRQTAAKQAEDAKAAGMVPVSSAVLVPASGPGATSMPAAGK